MYTLILTRSSGIENGPFVILQLSYGSCLMSKLIFFSIYTTTSYSTVRYNTVLDITQFKDGSNKCIDNIEK